MRGRRPQQSPKRGEVSQGILSFLLVLRPDHGGDQLKATGGWLALPLLTGPTPLLTFQLSTARHVREHGPVHVRLSLLEEDVSLLATREDVLRVREQEKRLRLVDGFQGPRLQRDGQLE